MVVVLVVVLVLLGLLVLGIYVQNARQAGARRALDLAMVSAAADDDIREFAGELAELRAAPAIGALTSGTQREYDRALAALDAAGTALAKATRPIEIGQVTQSLERGRYSIGCVRARLSGHELPSRRPPCFFNPQHGPSRQDVDWAPRGEQPRPLPACAGDAEHVAVGADPDIRKVAIGTGAFAVEYWRAGNAFAGYVHGYFGSFVSGGLLPSALTTAMQGAADDESGRFGAISPTGRDTSGRDPDPRADG